MTVVVSCFLGELTLSPVGVDDRLPRVLLNSSEGRVPLLIGGTVVLYTLPAGEFELEPEPGLTREPE